MGYIYIKREEWHKRQIDVRKCDVLLRKNKQNCLNRGWTRSQLEKWALKTQYKIEECGWVKIENKTAQKAHKGMQSIE